MRISSENKKAIVDGFKKAKTLMEQRILQVITPIGEEILTQATETISAEREWLGFTGNAQNSLTGYLINKKGLRTSFGLPFAFNGQPLRSKIGINEWAWLPEPYEGDKRSVLGAVDLETQTAENAVRRLEHKPISGNVFAALRFMFATEYNEFLPQKSGSPYETLHGVALLALQGLSTRNYNG